MVTVGLHTTDALAFQSAGAPSDTVVAPSDAVSSTEFRMEAGSRIWIEGSTSLAGFDCLAQQVTLGSARVYSDRVDAQVDVAVDELECGKSRMNRDLQEAMKSEEFPQIQYRLSDASTADAREVAGETTVQATGFLTIAGVERQVIFNAIAKELHEGSYRLHGRLPLKMTDFNITPPRPLRGLIRVRDEIVVHFDLVLTAANENN